MGGSKNCIVTLRVYAWLEVGSECDVSCSLQDLHKMESKLQEKQLKDKQEEERQKRLAKLKEKVLGNINL